MRCVDWRSLRGSEGGLEAPRQSTLPEAWLDSFQQAIQSLKEQGLTKPCASAHERQYPHKGVLEESRDRHVGSVWATCQGWCN